MDCYRPAGRVGVPFAVAYWTTLRHHVCPQLAVLAIRQLTMPVSRAMNEHVFSMMSGTDVASRRRMGETTFKNVLFARANRAVVKDITRVFAARLSEGAAVAGAKRAVPSASNAVALARKMCVEAAAREAAEEAAPAAKRCRISEEADDEDGAAGAEADAEDADDVLIVEDDDSDYFGGLCDDDEF